VHLAQDPSPLAFGGFVSVLPEPLLINAQPALFPEQLYQRSSSGEPQSREMKSSKGCASMT